MVSNSESETMCKLLLSVNGTVAQAASKHPRPIKMNILGKREFALFAPI
jgi:hypothetical protein